MQQSKTIEIWVGLFVAIGVIALFFMAMQVSNLGDLKMSDESYRIIARFANAGSLKVRAPVSVAGVHIGRVSNIRFDKDNYEAVVEMRIEPEFDTLPKDTTASVLTQGLLGEQYIGLTPGGDEEFLKDGEEIELTQSAMVLEQVISRFLFSKAESGGTKKAEGEEGSDSEDAAESNPAQGEKQEPVQSASPSASSVPPPADMDK